MTARKAESDPKPCTKCEMVLPLSEFYFHKTNNRYYSACKDCTKIHTYKWTSKHPEYFRQYSYEKYQRERALNSQWYQDRKEYYRNYGKHQD